jgi:hypothetical protein
MASPKQRVPGPPAKIRLAGIAIRTLFIVVLVIVTARVATPQNERIWSAYETPGDFVRVILGGILCAWFLVQVFFLPKDAAAYRLWLYLGSVVLPLSIICALAIW